MPDIRPLPSDKRRATNVTLSEALVGTAKALGVNVSQACEAGLAAQVKAAQAAKWLEENRPAIEQWNRYVEENGLLLAEYRQF
jgi:antitoxin CcdA